MNTVTINRPDDWHVHFRDGDLLEAVVPHTARQFERAIVMPNLTPPITTVSQAVSYRKQIRRVATHAGFPDFRSLMTAYLTDNIDRAELEAGFNSGVFTAAKLYPAGATTNSDAGVTAIENISSQLELMEKIGMPLCVHGECVHRNGDEVDPFDRERAFLQEVLPGILERFPKLKVILEHITTCDAVNLVQEYAVGRGNIGATITAHHLHIDRRDIFRGGIRPDRYCLPIAKRAPHRAALIKAATSAEPYFFAGTDSAPHPQGAKHAACGCAGIYTAFTAVELYAQAFENSGAADWVSALNTFLSVNGAAFYGLPRNEEAVTLQRHTWEPELVTAGDDVVTPFTPPNQKLSWRMVD